jgi:hypothetical protein
MATEENQKIYREQIEKEWGAITHCFWHSDPRCTAAEAGRFFRAHAKQHLSENGWRTKDPQISDPAQAQRRRSPLQCTWKVCLRCGRQQQPTGKCEQLEATKATELPCSLFLFTTRSLRTAFFKFG